MKKNNMKISGLPSDKKLSLTNNGELSIFTLGVGSAFTKKHYQNNIIIIKGENHVLVDCGTKTPQALYQLGVGVGDIQNLIITHSHGDHIGGLEELILLNRYVEKKKPVIYITPQYQQILWDMSLRGGTAFNEEREGVELCFGDMFTIRRPRYTNPLLPRETQEIEIGSLNIKLFRTMHIPDSASSWQSSFWSCGLIIDDRIMFTSDTRFDKDLILNYADFFDLEYIFHDCQFNTGGVHAGIDELSELPAEIRQKMILMHYGDDWRDHQNKVKKFGFRGLAKQWYFYNFGDS